MSKSILTAEMPGRTVRSSVPTTFIGMGSGMPSTCATLMSSSTMWNTMTGFTSSAWKANPSPRSAKQNTSGTSSPFLRNTASASPSFAYASHPSGSLTVYSGILTVSCTGSFSFALDFESALHAQ